MTDRRGQVAEARLDNEGPSTKMHDIYDPPPALEQEWTPPKRERLIFTTGDLVCLVGLCALLFSAAVLAWQSEPELAIATAAAGSLVILESWLTALGYLHRCRPLGLEGAVDDLPGRSGALARGTGNHRDRDVVAILGLGPDRLRLAGGGSGR